MDIQVCKRFLDTCHKAKRVVELMPKLPRGMTPRHVHVIDVIHQLERDGGRVKVGDISAFLGVTQPSITKLVGDLERLGAVSKTPDPDDGRVTRVALTELGRAYEEDYFDPHTERIAAQLGDLTDAEVETAIRVIERFHAAATSDAMQEG